MSRGLGDVYKRQQKGIAPSFVASKIRVDEQQQKKKKIGRNEPCPCGSGKKYKRCCGK